MQNHEEREILRIAERLAEIKPNDESTRRSIQRTRVTLQDQITRNLSRPRRTALPLRIAVGLAVVVGIVGPVAWLFSSGNESSLVFADVQKRISTTRTVTFSQTEQQKGKPDAVMRVMVSGPTLIRADFANGNYSITDFKQHKAMLVMREKKQVQIMKGLAFPKDAGKINVYEKLRDIHKDATRRLPGREINGKRTIGFEVTKKFGKTQQDLKVWVDAETKLPIRLEETESSGTTAVERIMADFVFDRKLDESAFLFTPPKEFTVETFGVAKLQPEPKETAEAELIVTPLVGIGPAKFGMSKDEVIKLLDNPDEILKLGTGAEQLEYYSRGFGCFVSHKVGLLMVSCYSQKLIAVQVRNFKGKTDKGIGLGASRDEIVRAYGQPSSEIASTNRNVHGDDMANPDRKTGQTSMNYDELRLSFTLYDDKVYSIIVRSPRRKKNE